MTPTITRVSRTPAAALHYVWAIYRPYGGAMSARHKLGTVLLWVAVLVVVALVWLGFAAPVDTHPLFYFGLILFGGGAVALLFSGVGAAAAGSRSLTTPELDLQFFAGIRRLVLAMLLCAVVIDVFGVLVMLAIAGGRGSTPLSTGSLAVAFAAAAITVVCAAITSVVMRHQLPTG